MRLYSIYFTKQGNISAVIEGSAVEFHTVVQQKSAIFLKSFWPHCGVVYTAGLIKDKVDVSCLFIAKKKKASLFAFWSFDLFVN